MHYSAIPIPDSPTIRKRVRQSNGRWVAEVGGSGTRGIVDPPATPTRSHRHTALNRRARFAIEEVLSRDLLRAAFLKGTEPFARRRPRQAVKGIGRLAPTKDSYGQAHLRDQSASSTIDRGHRLSSSGCSAWPLHRRLEAALLVGRQLQQIRLRESDTSRLGALRFREQALVVGCQCRPR